MSDTIISAIISSTSGLLGVLIGSYITTKNLKRDRSDKYLLAALDNKLKAHQQAYELSCYLPSVAHKSENNNTHIKKCDDWYRNNCLYLESEARLAFFNAIRTAADYYIYLSEWKNTGDFKELKKKWAQIIEVKTIIERNVSKPLILPNDIKKEEFDFKGEIVKNKKEE